jgi:hypothetical protein
MKKPILVYDISMCPSSCELSMEQVIEIYQEAQIVLYDSTEGNIMHERKPPYLCDGEGVELVSVDLGLVNMTREEILKLLDEKK